jgi:pimeloyl-ACP methyl ester carboxylesterase
MRDELMGMSIFWQESEAPEGVPTPVYLHGVPTHSDDWIPFLEKTGGVAPDLPGFGRSDKPAEFDYSIDGYAGFLNAFLDSRGIDRYSLVVHDWGAVGLALAQKAPERVARLVIMNAVPFLPGYRWHRIARIWRRRLIGELFMGSSTRFGFKQLSREAQVAPGPMPDEVVDSIWRHFDHGTQRAILKLYRSAPEPVLAKAGERLGDLGCLSLVAWGTQDPYIPAQFGKDYADALGGPVKLVELDDAGHWPWLDRPDLVDTVSEFLLAPGA